MNIHYKMIKITSKKKSKSKYQKINMIIPKFISLTLKILLFQMTIKVVLGHIHLLIHQVITYHPIIYLLLVNRSILIHFSLAADFHFQTTRLLAIKPIFVINQGKHLDNSSTTMMAFITAGKQ